MFTASLNGSLSLNYVSTSGERVTRSERTSKKREREKPCLVEGGTRSRSKQRGNARFRVMNERDAAKYSKTRVQSRWAREQKLDGNNANGRGRFAISLPPPRINCAPRERETSRRWLNDSSLSLSPLEALRKRWFARQIGEVTERNPWNSRRSRNSSLFLFLWYYTDPTEFISFRVRSGGGGFLILWRVFEILERGDWIRSSYLRGAILRGSIRMVGKFGDRGYTGCLEGFCSGQFVSFVEFHLLERRWNII